MNEAQRKDALLKAIKDAVMVEVKGQQLYSHAAEQATDAAARAMFQMLARDEDDHVRILTTQYRNLLADGHLNLAGLNPAELDHGSQTVITDDFKRSVRKGSFEMAVISIGCDLENKAIAYYRDHAARTEDADLKQLFTWLLEWEDGHLTQLLELEKIYQDAYWSEQGFSPM